MADSGAATAAAARGWTRVETADGSFYFQNKSAGLTSWDRPADVPDGVEIPLYHRQYKGKVQTTAELYENGTGAATSNSAESAGKSSAGTAADSSAVDLSAAGLKTPWVKVLAEDSGEYYYMNRKTRTTTWDRPDTGGIPIPMWGAKYSAPVPVALPEAAPVTIQLAVDASPSHCRAEAGKPSAWGDDDTEGRRPEFQSTAAMAPLWQEVKENGDTFYRNKQTGETAWERPADVRVVSASSENPGEESEGGDGATHGNETGTVLGRRAAKFGIVLDSAAGAILPLAEAVVRVGLQSAVAARERSAFIADGSHEPAVFDRLAAFFEILKFPPYSGDWALVDDSSGEAMAKTVISHLKGNQASGDVRSIVAQIVVALWHRIPLFASDATLPQLLEQELGFERLWAHCLAGFQESTFLRENSGRIDEQQSGTANEQSDDEEQDTVEYHDPSMLAFLGILELMALDFKSVPGETAQAPPAEISEVLIKCLSNCTDDVFPVVCMRLVDISHMLSVKEFDDHVIKGLTEYKQARHLSEGLVHVLNEFRFPCKDEAFLGKVIRLFIAIISNPQTSDFFYSNDLKVLIDIILRESEDMPLASKMQALYLQLVDVILRLSPWGSKSGKYRHQDVANMLTIAAEAPDGSRAKALARKILAAVDLEE
eukprot:INCI4235.2.p1 GENE.INCI4235.2~~INCI4235.2.p1  ORF type:complete len:656 (-),score=119.69 INCI4235.2:72-2039(-)